MTTTLFPTAPSTENDWHDTPLEPGVEPGALYAYTPGEDDDEYEYVDVDDDEEEEDDVEDDDELEDDEEWEYEDE